MPPKGREGVCIIVALDAGSEYEKTLAEEITKLQRLCGGGDLTSSPVFKFTEPEFDKVLPEVNISTFQLNFSTVAFFPHRHSAEPWINLVSVDVNYATFQN